MAAVYSRDQLYDVSPELRETPGRWGTPGRPFSRSYTKIPIEDLVKAIKLLHDHLIHEREISGITEEELVAIRSIQLKMKTLREDDLALRKRQDTILRCLHPDGGFYPYLTREEIVQAYQLVGADPVLGVGALRMGWPNEDIFRLSDFLAKVEDRIRKKYDF